MAKSLHVDLDRVKEIALIGVRRAAMFMGLGVNAAANPAVTSYQLDGFYQIRLLPENLAAEALEKAKQHFRSWIIGNGLTELLHNYSLFLDEVYAVGLLFKTGGKGELIAANEARVSEFRNRTSIASKLRQIFQDIALESSFRQNFYGFTKARNALIHANGRVLREHCDDGQNSLSVAWPGFDMVGRYPDGREFELTPNLRVEADAEILIRVVDRRRVFDLGQVLRFEPIDIAEICFMVVRDVDAFIPDLIAIARDQGIQVRVGEASPNKQESS